MKRKQMYLLLVLAFAFCFSGCSAQKLYTQLSGGSSQKAVSDTEAEKGTQNDTAENAESVTLEEIPEFSGEPYVTLEENVPDFPSKDMTEEAFEHYSKLDSLGRCGTAYANIGQELMPTEERTSIGPVRPTGWHTVKYSCVDGKYLYNRCHLIGFQLAGENANEKNLITGTRYMNVDGMLPFENEVADYVKENDYHVLYRVTPIYDGDDLVAKGVQMEAYSVEDDGEGICFNVFVYNSQPGVEIDYATGDSHLAGEEASEKPAELTKTTEAAKSTETAKKKTASGTETTTQEYIVNTNTHKFHLPSCSSVEDMKAKNKKKLTGTQEELEELGYEPCKRCIH
jgi:DNA-entry nuclease